MNKTIGIIGLGKMGSGLVRRLLEQGWEVVGFNRSPESTQTLMSEGMHGVFSIQELVDALPSPKCIWLMVPNGDPVDAMLFGEMGLVSFLQKGDLVIDGGNSYFQDSIRRHQALKEQGISFLDVGVSGGPYGARHKPCLMIGGLREVYESAQMLFEDLAKEGSQQFFEGEGAGHFVKMVHNGIEYGMMQSIAEGFDLLKSAPFHLHLTDVTNIYQNGSVIESRLVGWLKRAYEKRGEALTDVSGSVAHTGEGEWTVKTAKEFGVPVSVIEESFQFRVRSKDSPSYAGKVLSALRHEFGGHGV